MDSVQKSTSAQGGYGTDHSRHGEEGRRTLQVNGKDLGLPVQALADEVAKVLGVRCVHHVEVVSVNLVSKYGHR